MQEPRQSLEPVYESRLPGSLARAKRWLVAHHMTLMAIADTPHSIALGSAIGFFLCACILAAPECRRKPAEQVQLVVFNSVFERQRHDSPQAWGNALGFVLITVL